MAAIFDNVFLQYKKCLCHLRSLEKSPSYVLDRNKKSFSKYGKVCTCKYEGVIKPFGFYHKFDQNNRI